MTSFGGRDVTNKCSVYPCDKEATLHVFVQSREDPKILEDALCCIDHVDTVAIFHGWRVYADATDKFFSGAQPAFQDRPEAG